MFGLVHDADGILDVYQDGDACSGFLVEFPDLADVFEEEGVHAAVVVRGVSAAHRDEADPGLSGETGPRLRGQLLDRVGSSHS